MEHQIRTTSNTHTEHRSMYCIEVILKIDHRHNDNLRRTRSSLYINFFPLILMMMNVYKCLSRVHHGSQFGSDFFSHYYYDCYYG